jgi:hypothetical protein
MVPVRTDDFRYGRGALLLATLASPLAAQQVAASGTELQINTYTPETQHEAAVARSSAGVVVVWESVTQDGSHGGIFGRRFTSGGSALGGEFQINVTTVEGQYQPAVAMSASGFVVVWHGTSSAAQEVFARRFDAAGAAIGGEFQVNTYTSEDQAYAQVAMDASGFVVVWQSFSEDGDSNGLFGQRFASSGARLGGEFQLNLHTQDHQARPAIARDASGFVVVWQSAAQDGEYNGVFGRRFDASGGAVGGEFQVNVATAENQQWPAVAAGAAGFLVTWGSFGQDGSSYGIFSRRFGSSGAPIGGDVLVNARTINSQSRPRVSKVGSRFVVTWESYAQDGDANGVFGRLVDGAGLPVGPDFQLSSYTTNNQYRPDVAGDDSRFVVTWQSYPQDLGTTGVFAQRFSVLVDFDVDGNGVVEPLTDTLLALRYAFGFRGATLIAGAVGANCTRCDAPSIEAYLASKV